MRAVVFKAPREVAVEEVPDARAERDDDVVVRVSSSALCGTDLHMYECLTPITFARGPADRITAVLLTGPGAPTGSVAGLRYLDTGATTSHSPARAG